MKFDGAARDLFYLGAIFLGAAAGCLIRLLLFRRERLRLRNRAATAAIYFISGTIAALTAAFIKSGGALPGEGFKTLLLACFIFSAMAVILPKAVAFPAFFLAVIAIIGLGIAFLRFPGPGAVLASGTVLDDGRLGLNLAQTGESKISPPLEVQAGEGGLEFTCAVLTAAHFIPVIGGQHRGVVTRIRSGSRLIYQTAPPAVPSGLGLLTETRWGAVLKDMPPGSGFSLRAGKDSLVFTGQ